MTNLQIEKTSARTIATDIQSRMTNPFGIGSVKLFENYQSQNMSNGQEIEENQYKNLQKAESNYFLAGTSLGKSNAIKQFNMIAKMQGYDRVSTLHRHDI